jgi:LmbE family N-acetylglucosaminyl deacetylase
MSAPAGLLIATAHPDDETFGCGGTTALLIARGRPVHVVLATDGQAGEITDPDLDRPEHRADLAPLRRAEAQAAAAVLGTTSLEFLGHRDGQLGAVGDEALAREVAACIRRHRPAVVVSFGPDGIYGHPDHLAIHRATRRAWDLAADPALDLDGLAPHEALRLFYQAMPLDLAEARNRERGPVDLGGVPHPFVGYPEAELTTRVDIGPVREQKLEALRRHRSQTHARFEQLAALYAGSPLYESYRLAERRVPDAPGLAGDLFAGLP